MRLFPVRSVRRQGKTATRTPRNIAFSSGMSLFREARGWDGRESAPAGLPIQNLDCGPTRPLASTGRAYYGDHLQGTVTASEFGTADSAAGEVATALGQSLVKHLQRLNQIRRAVPAVQTGQYSTDDAESRTMYIHVRAPGDPPPVGPLLDRLDGQIPDGIPVVVDVSRGRRIDAGRVGG
jgi:hypothetical protein